MAHLTVLSINYLAAAREHGLSMIQKMLSMGSASELGIQTRLTASQAVCPSRHAMP